MLGSRGSAAFPTKHTQDLAHYALATTDLEFHFPFGWDELWGIANRGAHDLKAHAAAAGAPMEYRDPITNVVSGGK